MTRPRAAVAACLLALVGGASVPSMTLAESPSPATTPDPEPLPTGQMVVGEAWLDAPAPTGGTPGSQIRVGAFLWSPEGHEAVRGATLQVRLLPATGAAEPSISTGAQDWPGHYVSTLTVPEGGAGRLELWLPGHVCNESGCTDPELTFEVRGSGPPPDASAVLLSTATLHAAASNVKAGEPFDVDVQVAPRVAWPGAGLVLPEQLAIQVRFVQGAVIEEVPAPRAGPDPGHYRASVALDTLGEFVLQAALRPGAAEDELYGTAITRVVVVSAGGAAAPSPGAAASQGGLPEWWPLAAGAALLIVALLLILGGRRGDRPRMER